MNDSTTRWIAADKAHCWHPFTRQDDWVAADPLVLVNGEGVWLTDSEGRRYIDGNASIWTNVHGHKHPVINAGIASQLEKVAHTSFLGFSNPRASELAERLCAFFPDNTLERVFYSDDGSTAVECAVKLEIQFRMQSGDPERTEFIAFDQAYHGDTMGAASLGGVSSFFDRFRKFGFPVTHVSVMDDLTGLDPTQIRRTAAVIIEPLVQGVNQINVWPDGMLSELRAWCDHHGVHLILDEVMTGFGRTGTMFACQREQVIPDFLCLAKGLTGGYLPLAATMMTAEIYGGFLGGADRAFYYGHSYTANQLGCAAALASLDVFEQERTLEKLPVKVALLAELLAELQSAHPSIYEVRQCGMVAGVELRRADGRRFAYSEHVGEKVCLAARKFGLLIRPVLDTLVLMPPLSITEDEIRLMCQSLGDALGDAMDSPQPKRVAVVGVGAIGGYYGGRLAEAGMDVTFLLRSDFDYVVEKGLRVESIAGDFHLRDVDCVRASCEIGAVDLVIVAWKTTSNLHYQKVIEPLLHERTQILTLQNGLGNCEALASLFGAQRVFGALCFICSNRLAPGVISHTASGQMRVGEYAPDGSGRLHELTEYLKAGGISCRAVENLEQAQWSKLVWNIPFNGLAISEGGVDTQVLLATPGMEARIHRIMVEVQSVATALGYRIDDTFIDQQISVTRTMRAYRPSSMIDFVEGKEVEVDAIWREPYRRARALGVHVPEIRRLLDEIEAQLSDG